MANVHQASRELVQYGAGRKGQLVTSTRYRISEMAEHIEKNLENQDQSWNELMTNT